MDLTLEWVNGGSRNYFQHVAKSSAITLVAFINKYGRFLLSLFELAALAKIFVEKSKKI